MKVLCVIPARLGSTRLKNKPLALIGNKPMIQRTYEAASQCPTIHQTVVATDSDDIAMIIRDIGGQVAMTSSDIKTGTDRVAVVAEEYSDADVIINLQGDEPFVKPEALTELVQPFFNSDALEMATLATSLDFKTEYENPDITKVVIDKNHNALYFSRSPIPCFRDGKLTVPVYHHQGIYAFTREFLKIYTGLPQTSLEKAEALEQLRVMENGYPIRVVVTEHKTMEINTPEELARAQLLV